MALSRGFLCLVGLLLVGLLAPISLHSRLWSICGQMYHYGRLNNTENKTTQEHLADIVISTTDSDFPVGDPHLKSDTLASEDLRVSLRGRLAGVAAKLAQITDARKQNQTYTVNTSIRQTPESRAVKQLLHLRAEVKTQDDDQKFKNSGTKAREVEAEVARLRDIPERFKHSLQATRQGERTQISIKVEAAAQGNQISGKASDHIVRDKQTRTLALGNYEGTSSSKNTSSEVDKPVKYLLYICDEKVGCYGLSDRQRAMVGMYYLAELTGRRFGLIMTSPGDLRNYYEPNLVQWNISMSDLPRNASTLEIQTFGRNNRLDLDKIDFDAKYPQDIIFVRTNQPLWKPMGKNPIYMTKKPQWLPGQASAVVFGTSWLRLMKPTETLRSSLNEILISIAQRLHEEADVWRDLEHTTCCKKIDLPRTLPRCPGNHTICSKDSSTQECCEKLKDTTFAGCPELRAPCSGIDSKECVNHLSLAFPGRWDITRVETLAHNYCTLPAPTSRHNETVDSIRSKTGYDLTDMNLVCAHIRLGHSKTFFFEGAQFTKLEELPIIWEFLKAFAQKGFHIYLLSDAQEVKTEGKAIFGERLHTSQQEIVHIDHAQKAQDPEAGLQFALTEQLLLATSCREVIRSNSGYSLRAVEIRKMLKRKGSYYYTLDRGVIRRTP